MTQFDDRERAIEAKFGMEEESHFVHTVRAARLFGAWAAEQMGLADDEAKAYIAQLGDVAVMNSEHEHLIKKVEQDFQAKGVNVTRHRLEKEMNECDSAARSQAAS